MKRANVIVMTLAGGLLAVAALLKFHEMLTSCAILPWKEHGIWESYEFFLVQIPLEFALGIWMISGLFRKAAWAAGMLAYFGFIFVTLTKALGNAESCGCFGQVHIDPWITLFAIDIPFFLLLAIFRPRGEKLLPPPWPNPFHALAVAVPVIGFMVLAAPIMVAFRPVCKKPEQWTPVDPAALKRPVTNRPATKTETPDRLVEPAAPQVAPEAKAPETNETPKPDTAAIAAQIPASEPNAEPSAPAVPEGQNWQSRSDETESPNEATESTGPLVVIVESPTVNFEPNRLPEAQAAEPNRVVPAEPNEAPAAAEAALRWPWLEHIDIADRLDEGLAVVLMYHHDCPTCAVMVPKYSEYCRQVGPEEGLTIAFLAVPPYGGISKGPVPADTSCLTGKLSDKQNWLIMSPYVVALIDGAFVRDWPEGTAPEPENLMDEIFGQ